MNTTVRFISCTVVFMCDVLTAEARNAEPSAGQGTRTERAKV